MADIFVWPDESSIPLDPDSTLLDLAVDAGVGIAHLCGGRARCSTCRIRIVDGLDQLSERTDEEAKMADRLDFPAEIRLACQTRASGPVGFWRLVLDQIDLEMASQLGEGHYVGPVGREVSGAALMFTDVAGFTAMSEVLPAYDIVHILNRFFGRVGEAVETRGGRIDNYMGDGLLAAFGIDGQPEAAVSAVETGFEVLEVAADMNDYVHRIYDTPFAVRVGIASGEVIFGLMGAESSARETVVGDVVNTASRLESANKTIGTRFLVSEDVRAATLHRVEYGRRFDLDLAGKDDQVAAYEPIGLFD